MMCKTLIVLLQIVKNGRNNCLCKSFVVCIANVNNCKPSRPLLGGYHPHHRDCTL